MASVLLIAPPGRLRDGFRAILGAIPWVANVTCVSGGAGSYQAFLEKQPSLVFVDVDTLGDKGVQIVKRIRTACQNTRIVAIVATWRQREQAQRAGADAVLFSGFSNEKLYQAMTELLGENQLLTR